MPKGLILRKFVFDVCVCCFWVCVRTDSVVLDDLWFDDLRAEWVGERFNIAFGHDVILCG